MDRSTVLWTLVVFFGATVLFGLIRDATEDQPAGVTIGLQALAGAALVIGLISWVRRRR